MDKISEKGIQTNESFWNFIKLFMTNKGFGFKVLTVKGTLMQI